MKKFFGNGFNQGSCRNSKQNQNKRCTSPTSRGGCESDSELKKLKAGFGETSLFW